MGGFSQQLRKAEMNEPSSKGQVTTLGEIKPKRMPSSDTQRAHIHLEKLKNTEKSLPAAEVSAAFADPYFAQSGCDALPAIY